MSEIYVCQAGSCKAQGSEAVLLEIEELTKGLVGCSVRASGCVGACSQAPNVIVAKRGASESLHTRLDTVEKSAEVVREATGHTPSLQDPVLLDRLAAARSMRIRQVARGEQKWNKAMAGMAQRIANTSDEDDRAELQFDLAELCVSAGQYEEALGHLAAVKSVAVYSPQVYLSVGKVLRLLHRFDELDELAEDVAWTFQEPRSARIREYIGNFLRECKQDAIQSAADPTHFRRIEGYARWKLCGIVPVSPHTAIYHFTSSDLKRGTPYARGRGRTMWHKTWHTTLLAEVGENNEGPLPWIERDYTPVSTWIDWEKGNVDILIKIYPNGTATSWLHKQPIGCHVWLSQPKKTMAVPSLTLNSSRIGNDKLAHQGVLLLVAGTGIVVASQVMHHMDPNTCFGTSTNRTPPLRCPTTVIYACRQDDVLMAGDLSKWCSSDIGHAKLQRCVLAISSTQDQASAELPFQATTSLGPTSELRQLASVPNLSIVETRVTSELIQHELALLHELGQCRIVISGPESFNCAMKNMLIQENGIVEDLITVLSG
ncbi:hypothetical protein CYMTET_36734 [Cymbomonas tetramitiformis]|uniref:FAD-binding FR-type domain-containing protein n=1 Tax=Cymbomonas tetramitiformis TaxID=36881 RepID=A0AAE0CFE6_9CHLO|nr:hypothetical protein CYMTET_45335 [Cymbomonas tetramitiformis]KAK3254038.1 hypothetical protein CYMTET_36734 [Cymbomonas tetramitiformis]|eukprot:gene21174-25434_t